MRRVLPLIVLGACVMTAPRMLELDANAAVQQSPAGADRLSGADLEEMLAPIALYPDPLLANVLAASVYPDQLKAAKAAGGNDATIDGSDWEPSVKAIAKIPDALTMLTEYPDWTAALGEAFILQSQDVMSAVQRLRARAQASGALQTTPQQVVQTQGDTIIIQPAQPEIVYVPTYNPQVVYVDNHNDEVAAGLIGFGLGVTTGLIIANNIDCDWHGGYCCYGCGWGWHGGYHGGDYNGGHNTKINIDTGGGDINIGGGNTNIGSGNVNRPGAEGGKWKPNQAKMSQSLAQGQAPNLNKYKGTGQAGANANARIPNRQTGAAPISQNPAPRPSTRQAGGAGGVNAPARPSAQPVQRPADMQSKGSGPKAGKPSIPPTSARPPVASSPSRGGGGGAQAPRSNGPSAYGGGGGGQKQATSRGASSRGSAGGGRSSGGSRGGGGGGGSRGGGGGRGR